ncbi:MAG TPA: polysaccharide biosynthesis protein [Paenibacillaceae bacterium]|nr:polysaccharide biosynthesis protein [Paenibacillaceae bacterium]
MSFIKGAAILGAGALISKFLGALYRIPYQNITGDLGYYVYTQVYPLYSALLILATAGFPIAISKIVAEKLAVGDEYGARRVFRVSSFVLSITGVVFFLLLWFGAPWIAGIMSDDKLAMPIRAVSYALLIVPIMASIRGFFQGYHNMVPTAVSQIGEQFVRVITILILSYWFMKSTGDVYLAGSGAVFGAVTGAIFGFILLLFYIGQSRRQNRLDPLPLRGKKESVGHIVRKLLFYAIPICLGSLILPLMQLIDSFTVVNILVQGGTSEEDSYILKGVLDRGQPLVQLAAVFATALSLSLVPAIAEANARKKNDLISSRTELAIRLTFLIGLPASIGLAVVAEPVNIMLYKTNSGTGTLMVLAFSTVFTTLGVTTAGILQGLGKVMLPVRNLFIGLMVKLVLNFIFIPMYGIAGGALATVISHFVSTFLNMMAVSKLTGVRLYFKSFILKPAISVVVMALAAFVVKQFLDNGLDGIVSSERLQYTIVGLGAVLAGIIMYGIALFLSGTVTRKDMESTPKGKRWVPLLQKFHLLRDS